MLKHFIAASAALGLTIGAANAAVIDFAAEADNNGERGEADFTVLTINGVNVRVAAGTMDAQGFIFVNTTDEIVPYLDESINGEPGGLGVCRLLENGPGSECADSSDDSIDGEDGFAEGINIFFPDMNYNITSLSFYDGNHNSLNMSNALVNYAFGFGSSSDTGMQTASFAELVQMASNGLLSDVRFMNFGFAGTEFYLSAFTAEVPIPGALPLLLSGIAGLGFASRRKKTAAA